MAGESFADEDDLFLDAFPYIGKPVLVTVKHGWVMEALEVCYEQARIDRHKLQKLYSTALAAAIDADLAEPESASHFCSSLFMVAVLRRVLVGSDICISVV